MTKLVGVFISERNRAWIGLTVWVLAFAAIMAGIAMHGSYKFREAMRLEARTTIEHFERLGRNLSATLDAMVVELTAEPCTPGFTEQLRTIAYRPDGLNEFLHAPGGRVECSTSVGSFVWPVELGPADIAPGGDGQTSFWIDRDMGDLALRNLRGTIALRDPYAAVIPPQMLDYGLSPWIEVEVVLADPAGQARHFFGTSGVHARAQAAVDGGAERHLSGFLHDVVCEPHGLFCTATEGNIAFLAWNERVTFGFAIICAAILASAIAVWSNQALARYWSFDQRFRRHLDADSIVCAYQPLMDLQSGQITGCEVLARWRDVDGSVVFPDRFLPLVEKLGLTGRFTEMVADRACRELTAMLPRDLRLQVNFNIFPRDLNAAELTRMFRGFTNRANRFELVLEIIESDQMPASAQTEVEALRRAGIKIYMDDFGAGYSNMHSLAALSVDGVKLDRSFGMAPDDSMMAMMLTRAVEMIHATGRIMVVEGVETEERLALLREMTSRVDFVQGYHISRPLDIEGLVAFLAARQPAAAREAA
jgi:sensor c-di-GMP phosphodiesterase-like protein